MGVLGIVGAMNKLSLAVIATIISALCFGDGALAADPKKLVAETVAAVGGKNAHYPLKDVEYTYTYTKDGKKDVSTERYVFDGELSWAEYVTSDNLAPEVSDPITQGYDGSKTWVKIDGQLLADEMMVRRADFLRKTNYYWFAMFFKLLDPGMTYEYLGDYQKGDITYDVVKAGFEPGVGDVQDYYQLYINRETKLVDFFLFTVMDFGMEDALLMEVEFEEIDGVKLPTKRRYAPAVSWEDPSPKPDAAWVDEISTAVKFGNGFGKELFQP